MWTSVNCNIHICFSLCGLNSLIPKSTAYHQICCAQLFLLCRMAPIQFSCAFMINDSLPPFLSFNCTKSTSSAEQWFIKTHTHKCMSGLSRCPETMASFFANSHYKNVIFTLLCCAGLYFVFLHLNVSVFHHPPLSLPSSPAVSVIWVYKPAKWCPGYICTSQAPT